MYTCRAPSFPICFSSGFHLNFFFLILVPDFSELLIYDPFGKGHAVIWVCANDLLYAEYSEVVVLIINPRRDREAITNVL